MTDLSTVLPTFPVQDYVRLLPSLERNAITTADLVSLDVVEIARRARLPLLDLKRLCESVLGALVRDLGVGGGVGGRISVGVDVGASVGVGAAKGSVADCGIGGDLDSRGLAVELGTTSKLRTSGREVISLWETISTLDEGIDAALGGGIPTGCITEITGESGAGKTQFLLTLLLSSQLPAPYGLSRTALYISTESALPTNRLSQMLTTHPFFAHLSQKPSLDGIISIVTPDLESQDHILRFQVPVAIEKYNVGLIILDSVAANYRAEFERPGATRNGANMAKRSSELTKLGALLRSFAQSYNLAVVVANQVADRFASTPAPPSKFNQVPHSSYPATQDSPLAHRSMAPPQSSIPAHPASSIPPPSDFVPALTDTLMTLDHQQRWFTGWGDDADRFSRTDSPYILLPQKTPSLGLVWTCQVACRIALIKTPVYGLGSATDRDGGLDDGERAERVLRRWRRFIKVVFCAWGKPSPPGVEDAVEFEIFAGGLRSLGDSESVGCA